MCLVPFGDLLNHENPAPEAPADLGALFGFDQTSRAYVFRAQRRFAKGEEIFISYGRKANVELLSIYGFALEENEYDCVPLRANARLHALLPDVGRWAAVEESAIQGKWEIGWLNGAAAVSFPLLAALAHLCAGVPLAVANDEDEAVLVAAAAPALRALATAGLDALRGSVPENLDGWPRECARRVVAGEERLLRAVLSLVGEGVTLGSPDSVLRSAIQPLAVLPASEPIPTPTDTE
jgi:hypothetical protein